MNIRHLRWVLLTFGGSLLATLVVYYDPRSIIAILVNINAGWLGLSVLLVVFTTLLGAINVYLILDSTRQVSFVAFLRVYWLSWAINLIAPGQIGDLATISYALKDRGINISMSLGRSLLDKCISLAIMLCVATQGTIILTEHLAWHWNGSALIWIGGLPAGILFALLLALSGRRKWMKALFDPNQKGWRGMVGLTIREFLFTIRVAPAKVALNGFITSIKVCLTGLSYWCVFFALGYDPLPMTNTIAFATLAGLVAYLPISLNGVGTVEATGISLFGLLGIPSAGVLAAYLCLRISIIVLAWVPTLVWIGFAPKLNSHSG